MSFFFSCVITILSRFSLIPNKALWSSLLIPLVCTRRSITARASCGATWMNSCSSSVRSGSSSSSLSSSILCFFIYLFSKTLLNWSSFPIHHLLIERRVKTWNFIININIFLSYEIFFIVIHLCELFEELSKLVIQLRLVILNTSSHNAKLCKTILKSRFWNLFPSGW